MRFFCTILEQFARFHLIHSVMLSLCIS